MITNVLSENSVLAFIHYQNSCGHTPKNVDIHNQFKNVHTVADVKRITQRLINDNLVRWQLGQGYVIIT